jgi:zinc transport system ATP-binding protein
LFGEPAHSFADGHRIGYVAQGITNADRGIPVTVKEVVKMGRFPHAGYGRLGEEDHRIVHEAMQTTGIEDLADRRLQSLSGGQQQRAFVARALACEADLLALDEPTVGIDTQSRDAFYTLLRQLNDRGTTILLVEHDLEVITEYATAVACINCQLHYHGDPHGFADSDALIEAYGGSQQFIDHDHEHV